MDHLYDKIAEKDISNELLMKYKVKLDKTCFIMENRIESLGEYDVKFEYESIKKKLKVMVIKKK
jgi:ribosomal protein L9